jgi:excisionase family DNA binding protein
MDCETLSVPEAAKVLGIGRVRMYEAVSEGRVPSLKIGTKPVYRIPRKVIDQLLEDPRGFNRKRTEA